MIAWPAAIRLIGVSRFIVATDVSVTVSASCGTSAAVLQTPLGGRLCLKAFALPSLLPLSFRMCYSGRPWHSRGNSGTLDHHPAGQRWAMHHRYHHRGPSCLCMKDTTGVPCTHDSASASGACLLCKRRCPIRSLLFHHLLPDIHKEFMMEEEDLLSCVTKVAPPPLWLNSCTTKCVN